MRQKIEKKNSPRFTLGLHHWQSPLHTHLPCRGCPMLTLEVDVQWSVVTAGLVPFSMAFRPHVCEVRIFGIYGLVGLQMFSEWGKRRRLRDIV